MEYTFDQNSNVWKWAEEKDYIGKYSAGNYAGNYFLVQKDWGLFSLLQDANCRMRDSDESAAIEDIIMPFFDGKVCRNECEEFMDLACSVDDFQDLNLTVCNLLEDEEGEKDKGEEDKGEEDDGEWEIKITCRSAPNVDDAIQEGEKLYARTVQLEAKNETLKLENARLLGLLSREGEKAHVQQHSTSTLEAAGNKNGNKKPPSPPPGLVREVMNFNNCDEEAAKEMIIDDFFGNVTSKVYENNDVANSLLVRNGIRQKLEEHGWDLSVILAIYEQAFARDGDEQAAIADVQQWMNPTPAGAAAARARWDEEKKMKVEKTKYRFAVKGERTVLYTMCVEACTKEEALELAENGEGEYEHDKEWESCTGEVNQVTSN